MQDALSISFVLPMFNEHDNIRNTIQEIRSIAGELADDYEIVVVDDASTDDSANIVDEMSKEDDKIKLIRLESNTKFGGAFAEGFRRARKDVILYMDSDMPVELEDIKTSFPLIRDVDVVTGVSSVKKGETLKRKVMSGVYNMLVQGLFSLSIRDINSGYKVVRRSILEGMRFISHSPFVDVELFIHVKKKKGSIKEFPLVFRQRSGGQSYMARIPIILATFRDMIKVRIFSNRKNR